VRHGAGEGPDLRGDERQQRQRDGAVEGAPRAVPAERARVRQHDRRARERIAHEEDQLSGTVRRVDVTDRVAVLVEDDGDADEEHGGSAETAEDAEDDQAEQRVEEKKEVAGVDVGRHPAISRTARRSSFPRAVSGSAGVARTSRGTAYSGRDSARAARTWFVRARPADESVGVTTTSATR